MALYTFIPSSNSAFTFQPTLDGNTYQVTVTWSLFGQRYYVNCYTLSGQLVFSLPLISSVAGQPIQGASWAPNMVTLQTASPHGFRLGVPINLTVVGMSPTGYNGAYQMTPVDPVTLTYPLDIDPGAASTYGLLEYIINLAAGYFTTSTLVYRSGDSQFEVLP